MSINNTVIDTINRYGQDVKIYFEEPIKTKAFIEPLRYKHTVYIGGNYRSLAGKKSNKYLYVGVPEYEIKVGTKLEIQNIIYEAVQAELYSVKDEPIYCWAIMEPVKW